ncbi:MAG: AmmeMemoRadiSam system protein B, partial [Thermoanaerobaculales bacterium]|nr:AmmeMemoRadiSam system protein B [Thermoanaerobaculales bacterium]
MTRLMFLWPVLFLSVIIPRIGDSAEQAPTRAEVEAMMGLPSDGNRVRGQMDTTGFVVEEAPAEDVVATAVSLEHESLAAQDQRLGMTEGQGFIGGICPHDDHLYASRVYVHLTERITAPRVLLIGVFHRAQSWELQDRIVFDAFDAWHGPWGKIEIDPIREELVASLRPESFVIDNVMHCREHSLEAILPFLQRGHPDRTIVPILVPHMGWDRMTELTDELSTALASIMQENGWRLGTDIAVVVSSDAVHYGPDFNHAPFGTDTEAYDRAVARDLQLVDENLSGPLESAKLHRLLEALVDPETLEYRLPWCGRFSIPFG